MGSGCGIQLASGCGNQLGSDCDIFIIPICCWVFTLCKTVVFRKSSQVQEGFFLPHPSSPARRGSTSPPAPSPQEGAPTGKPAVLYSQASSRPYGVARDCLRNRIAISRRNRVAIIYAPRARCRIHTSADTPLWQSSIRRGATGA